MSKLPSGSLTLLTFWAAGNVSLAPLRRLHVPKPPQRPRRLTFPEEVRASPTGARIP